MDVFWMVWTFISFFLSFTKPMDYKSYWLAISRLNQII